MSVKKCLPFAKLLKRFHRGMAAVAVFALHRNDSAVAGKHKCYSTSAGVGSDHDSGMSQPAAIDHCETIECVSRT